MMTSLIPSRPADPSGSAEALDFLGVMVGQLFLVSLDLPVELVDEDIDRRIHVRFDRVGVDRSAAHVNRGFRFVLQLLDGQYAVDIRQVIEMSLESRELGTDVVAQ